MNIFGNKWFVSYKAVCMLEVVLCTYAQVSFFFSFNQQQLWTHIKGATSPWSWVRLTSCWREWQPGRPTTTITTGNRPPFVAHEIAQSVTVYWSARTWIWQTCFAQPETCKLDTTSVSTVAERHQAFWN